jgi:hypothetical protein
LSTPFVYSIVAPTRYEGGKFRFVIPLNGSSVHLDIADDDDEDDIIERAIIDGSYYDRQEDGRSSLGSRDKPR